MTKLDEFIPEGTPIHPYDLFEILRAASHIKTNEHSPKPEDVADYQRNKLKIGMSVDLDGVKYFQTTTIPYKTNAFDEAEALREAKTVGGL